MKKKVFISGLAVSICLLIIPGTLMAQKAADLFIRTGTEVVWLGLDFTQVRLAGDLGTVGRDEILPLFDAMNRLIVTERSKYNFEAALRRDHVPYDLEISTELNYEIDPIDVISHSSADRSSRLDEDAISVLVKQYNTGRDEGIGLVFFMESLDKTTERGTMWVTFFSLADRNVLFTERMSGTAGGFGFRNHWARTVYDVIDQIKKRRFADWRYKYSE
jgi:hypothetical protein